MIAPQTFASLTDFQKGMGNVELWRPYLIEALNRHDLTIPSGQPARGIAGTYPTYIWGDFVIKFFGMLEGAPIAFRAEKASYDALRQVPVLKRPHLLASGALFDQSLEAWPYLVMTRMEGEMWFQADLGGYAKCAIAEEIGVQIAALHSSRDALDSARADVPAYSEHQTDALLAACKRSSLPGHLIEQVPDFMSNLSDDEPVLVHGDLMERHIFTSHGKLSGIIDWGDVGVADRHYELAKLHLGAFEGQPGLLRAFLTASNWPMTADFPQRALRQSIIRQAIGLKQHPASFDAFHRIGQIIPDPNSVRGLEELAARLFYCD